MCCSFIKGLLLLEADDDDPLVCIPLYIERAATAELATSTSMLIGYSRKGSREEDDDEGKYIALCAPSLLTHTAV